MTMTSPDTTDDAMAYTGAARVDPGPIDSTRPHPARRYDYWLGGKDNFAVDRASGDAIAEVFPHVPVAARENRRFLHRVVAFLTAEAGVRQFLDVGAGIPTSTPGSPNVHELAQLIAPDSRIVYVDNDPMVLAHIRGRLTSSAQGALSYLLADLRDPHTILTTRVVRDTLDWNRPIGLLLIAVLHFLDDVDDPYSTVAGLINALPPGSYVALSHATYDGLPADTVSQLASMSAPGAGHGAFRARTRDEVARFVVGLDLVGPGLVPIVHWRPDRAPQPHATAAEAPAYGVVAQAPWGHPAYNTHQPPRGGGTR